MLCSSARVDAVDDSATGCVCVKQECEPVRSTDTSRTVAEHRYSVFKQHTETLRRLKEFFPYHVINAMGDMSDVQRAIKRCV
jgi:hypothetical protein